MAAIDYDDSKLVLALLVKVSYLDTTGSEATAYWCGPRERTGSALWAKDPETDTRVDWQGRIKDAEVDLVLGGFNKSAGMASRLMLEVMHGHPSEDEMVAELVDGRWEGREVRAYYLALEGDSKDEINECFRGTIDRDPEPEPARRMITLDVNEGWAPLRTPFPSTKLPLNADELTMGDVNGDGTSDPDPPNAGGAPVKPTGIDWHPDPNSVALHPSYLGHYVVGPIGASVSGAMWVELFPFGESSGTITATYAHVGPQTNMYCHEVIFEQDDGTLVDVLNDISGADVLTYEIGPDEGRMGPPGTNVRFGSGNNLFGYDVHGTRCWGRVSGHNKGAEWHATYLEPFYADTGTIVSDAWDVLEDIFEDSRFLGLTNVFATGALASFASAVPSSVSDWYQAGMTPLIKPSPEVPTVGQVVTELMNFLGADLVGRYSATDDAYRLFPIWRGPRDGDTADHRLFDFDLVTRTVPSLRTAKDPWGEYANRVDVKLPKRWEFDLSEDLVSDGLQNSAIHDDTTEQTAHGSVVTRTVEFQYYTPEDPVNAIEEGGGIVGEQFSQPQKVVQAMHGQHGLRVNLGELLEYHRIGWTPSEVGQVRRRRHRLSSGAVELQSWHGVTFNEATS